MRKTGFNEGWKYARLGEDDYREIILPHDAMLRERRGDDNASGVHGAWFEGHDYEYVKTFSLSAQQLAQRLTLEFEGIYRLAEVYVNGEKAAFRPYGFTNFYVPLTGFVKEGENELRVVARGADQPNCRWYAGAGIYRPVSLLSRPRKCLAVDGVKIRTKDYASRELEILFAAEEENAGGRAAFTVKDGENILFEGSAQTGVKTCFRLEKGELWSLENPRLYTLKAVYGEDEREISFGIRQAEVSREKGFTLNGERVILRGACVHGDNGLLGAAAWPFADQRKIALLKKAGYNAIRSAHNPCSKATLDACDRLGILVLDEYTDGWYIRKTRYDYADRIGEWWKQDLKDMVDKDYNHPSVVMYSIGNEVSETSEKKGIEFCGEMTEYLHGLDDRPVTCGVNIFFNYLFSLGFGVYSDKKAEQGQHVGSAFFNNIAGVFGDKAMKIGATLRGCDVKTRDAFEKLDVAGYNYGILRYKKDLKKYPRRIILGSETFCKDAYAFYEFAKTHTGLVGDFVWAGMDYLGEVGIGSWEYASYAKDFRPVAGWISAGSGRLDLTGRELGEALYTCVAFELDAIRMAIVPPDDYGKSHSPSAWKMTNARESWAWNGCEGKKTKVEVYARGYAVGLFLNGRRIGRKRVKKDCRTYFKIKYAPGTLTAAAYDKTGKELGKTSLFSGEGGPRLTLRPEREKIKETELAYIRIAYADETGKTLPLTRGRVNVKVENGELMALGHACPYNIDGYLKTETDTYYGEALAIVRPTGNSAVRVRASSPYGDAETCVKICE